MTNISTATPAALRQTLRDMRAENLDASTQLDLINSDVIDVIPGTAEHNGGNTDPHQVTTIRAGRLMARFRTSSATNGPPAASASAWKQSARARHCDSMRFSTLI